MTSEGIQGHIRYPSSFVGAYSYLQSHREIFIESFQMKDLSYIMLLFVTNFYAFQLKKGGILNPTIKFSILILRALV